MLFKKNGFKLSTHPDTPGIYTQKRIKKGVTIEIVCHNQIGYFIWMYPKDGGPGQQICISHKNKDGISIPHKTIEGVIRRANHLLIKL